jgi:hypothetical protein
MPAALPAVGAKTQAGACSMMAAAEAAKAAAAALVDAGAADEPASSASRGAPLKHDLHLGKQNPSTLQPLAPHPVTAEHLGAAGISASDIEINGCLSFPELPAKGHDLAALHAVDANAAPAVIVADCALTGTSISGSGECQ